METYGLEIFDETRYGVRRIGARVLARDHAYTYPKGAPSTFREWDNSVPRKLVGLRFDGLTLSWYVSHDDSTGEGRIYGGSATYEEPYAVDVDDARAMLRTLEKVERGFVRDAASANDLGDRLASMAQSLGLKWCVQRIGTAQASLYAHSEWRWLSIPEGRNAIRWLAQMATLPPTPEPTEA